MTVPSTPFFVMGCEASGNNLLSLMLNSHSRLCVFLGSHYYQCFEPYHESYGDLSKACNARRLVKDLLASLRARRLEVPLPAEAEVIEQITEGTFEGVLAAFLRAYGIMNGKPRAGERTSRHFVYLDRILSRFPESPVIFTMRDPRDAFVFVRDGLGMSCGGLALDWNLALKSYQDRSRPVHLVKYEELVTEPVRVLSEACRFLGESFEPQMLDFYRRTPTHFMRVPHHQRLAAPIDPSSIGIFRQLAGQELGCIQTACGTGMEIMGYTLATPLPACIASPHVDRSTSQISRALAKLRYYRFDSQRWRMGIRRWSIFLRIKLRAWLRGCVGLD